MLRRGFLDSRYSTAGEWMRLGRSPGQPPSWSAPGQCWAILTAWNPQGRPCDGASNNAAQEQLRAALVGWPFLEGVNGEGEWTEPSLIVPGLGLRQAAQFGQRFRQAAVLWGVGRRAALVWCPNDAGSAGLRLERHWLVAAQLV